MSDKAFFLLCAVVLRRKSKFPLVMMSKSIKIRQELTSPPSRLIYNNTAARWDPKMGKYCCGDFVLAVALRDDYGVELQQAFPMFSQERWSTVPLGNENFWCRPAITFHHLTPGEMKEIADFEDNRLNMSKLVRLILIE